MIVVMLSFLALTSYQDPGLPPSQNAQCLVEIAAMTGEDLDITEIRMRNLAKAKADALWINQRDLITATINLEEARRISIGLAPAEIRAGVLPEGSVEVMQRRYEREREVEARMIAELPIKAPSCLWPTREAADDDDTQLRSIED